MRVVSSAKNWNVSGSKFWVHEGGLTALVSDADSVYIYEGGSGKPLRTLTFNSRSGQALYADGSGSQRQYSLDDLAVADGSKEIYEKGTRILAASGYSPPPSEEGKIYEWMQSLLKRPLIDLEKLRQGHCLVASISKFAANGQLIALCYMLGDLIGSGADGSRVLYFKPHQDSDLIHGICLLEKTRGKIEVESQVNVHEHAIDQVHNENQNKIDLTREEARWLQGLLPPRNADRFLSIHREMLEDEDREKRDRGRRALRGASRATGNDGLFGNVAI